MSTPLPERPLGSGGPRLPVLGLGCAGYWARPEFAETDAGEVLKAALEAGVRLFDTGASYADGHAERRLGRLLRALGARPEDVFIATKIGTVRDRRGRLVKDFRAEKVIDTVAASLDRLGLERVDLLLLHGPGPGHLSEQLRRALGQVVDAGLAVRVGINAPAEAMTERIGDTQFQVLMPFLSVREPAAGALAAAAGARGQGVLAAGPLARMSFRPPLLDWLGRASGRWYLARALARAPASLVSGRALARALRHPGWTPAQLALAWVVEQPGVTAAVAGTTRPEHLRELAAGLARPLPAPVRRRLKAVIGDATQ